MKGEKVLIVDDVELNRAILSEILCEDYDIEQAENGIQAIEMLFTANTLPIIVLLDIMMPELDGYAVLEMMKQNPHTEHVPVIFITAADANLNEGKGLKMGATDYISKPFNPDVVKARVDNHVELKRYRDNLEAMVDAKVTELMETRDNMLEALASIIEYRNLESGEHVRRTRVLSQMLLNHLLKNPKYAGEFAAGNSLDMVKAVPLHDIGKISIPDNILLKPGRLTPEEFDVIKTHTVVGSQIIESLHMTGDAVFIKHCHDICRHHHENWNGTGYPDRLAGEEIPLSARIVSVVDVYDALVSPRVYKVAISHEEALSIIQEDSGRKFDPELVTALFEISGQFRAVNEGGA